MVRNIALLAIGCAGALLFSCQSPLDADRFVTYPSVQGTWEDHLDPNICYFAGETHKLTLENRSFFLKVFRFTDIYIPDTCYWLGFQYMKGTFAIGLQDSIILDGVYTDSLGNTLPPCGCTYGPPRSGSYRASFKGMRDKNALHLTLLSGPYPAEWVLEK